MQKILLKKNAEHKRKSFYPWIFKDELEMTNASHYKGEVVEIQTADQKFYCFGYMNAESQIPIRVLSFSAKDGVTTEEFWLGRFLQAWRLRVSLGKTDSFRLVFSESDFLPGFILDLYRVQLPSGGEVQVLALQVLTAGADRLMKDPVQFFEKLVSRAHTEGLTDLSWEKTGVVLRNDVNVRMKEGLRVEEPRFMKSFQDFDPRSAVIFLSGDRERRVSMICDLYEGQKTGFFLDQHQNIRRVCDLGKNYFKDCEKIRILDLCCYVGHWSAQLVQSLSSLGRKIEIHLVDISAQALERALKNVQAQAVGISNSVEIITHKCDVLETLEKFDSRSFDLVICDPPGFIKAKKDLEKGKSAYIRMNTESFKLVRPEGLLISCSCSGLLEENDFADVSKKSLYRSERQAKLILKGGPSFDHPALVQFPHSLYLKMFGFIVL